MRSIIRNIKYMEIQKDTYTQRWKEMKVLGTLLDLIALTVPTYDLRRGSHLIPIMIKIHWYKRKSSTFMSKLRNRSVMTITKQTSDGLIRSQAQSHPFYTSKAQSRVKGQKILFTRKTSQINFRPLDRRWPRDKLLDERGG